jgi:hypothetical protein
MWGTVLLMAVVAGVDPARIAARPRHRKDKVAVTHGPPEPGTRPSIEQLPGFDRLPPRAQTALKSESPWVAWIAGLAVGMPTAYYLAALAAILNSDGGAVAGPVGHSLTEKIARARC